MNRVHNNNFAIVAIKVESECLEYIRKVLKGGMYFFNHWYDEKNGELVQNHNADFIKGLYGNRVSVQAIVGQNGSGKSALMELVYRIINNLSMVMLQNMNRPAAQPLYYVGGIYATLYFESEGKIGSVCSKHCKLVFKWGEDDAIEFDVANHTVTAGKSSGEIVEYISRHFCYTLVCNYAMMSLVQTDFNRDVCVDDALYHVRPHVQNGAWIESIYHKNDGYQAALGIEPFKGEGKIDVNRQKQLNDERMAALLIDAQKHGQPFFEDYSLDSISLHFNPLTVSEKYNDRRKDVNTWSQHPEKEIENLWKNKNTFTHFILSSYGFEYFNTEDEIVRTAMAYVVYKTLSVAQKYPKYEQYRDVAKITYYAREIGSFDNKRIKRLNETGFKTYAKEYKGAEFLLESLCHEIAHSNSHAELKVRQALNFLKSVAGYYKSIGKHWTCPDIGSYELYEKIICKGVNLESPNDILEYYPPQFFKDTILVQEYKISRPLYSLSAGEKQFMQTLATIVYHLRNIISVEATEGHAKYRSVNLMLDEVETCFHPEFQQKFLKTLLDMLDNYGVKDHLAVNIIIATHSPFILSDIPDSNVLYLEGGKVPQGRERMKNTFCGNVCDMLHQSFFLHEGFMGHFAKMMVTDLIHSFKHDVQEDYRPLRQWDKEEARALIEMIGEPLLKNSLMQMWTERFGTNVDELIEWHKKEIERLKGRTD